MFEELEQEEREEKESRNKLLRASAVILGALVVIGAITYLIWHPAAAPSAKLSDSSPAVAAPPPDATRDLEVVRAAMGKDPSGLRVMWSVTIHNKSTVYTYYNFKYEALFVGPDGTTLSAMADTIPQSVGPAEQKTLPDFIGGMYNADASTYHFRLVGGEARKTAGGS